MKLTTHYIQRYSKLNSQYFHAMFRNQNGVFKLCWSTVIDGHSSPTIVQDADVCFSLRYNWLCMTTTI